MNLRTFAFVQIVGLFGFHAAVKVDSISLKPVVESHIKIEDEFGDLHCRWNAKVTKDGETREFDLQYWSKESKYFRLDTTEIGASSTLESPTERIVVRPEGFAILKASNVDDAGAIVGFGSSEEGLDRLAGNYFFNAAIRHSGVFPVSRAIAKAEAKEQGWSSVRIAEDANKLKLNWKWEGGNASTETSVILDSLEYHCLSAIVKNFTDGKSRLVISATKAYDENRVVPLHHQESWTYSDGTINSWEFSRTFLAFESPPIEIFTLPGPTMEIDVSGAWTRRLGVLATGLTMLVLYVVVRRRQAKAERMK